jgi:drug/metabolite transporter (DMT)-like permease
MPAATMRAATLSQDAITTNPDATTAPIGHRTAYLLAAVAMVIYSSPPVVTRAVSLGVPAMALSFSRWVIATLILLPFIWRKLPREWPNLKQHWPALVLMVLPMIVGSTLSVLAVYYTTATNAVLVNASQPALTAMFAWAIAGMRLLPAQRLGIACAFIGILVMIARADVAVVLNFELNVGDFLMLMAVAGWSLYAVLLQRVAYKPDGTMLMFLISIIGVIFLAPAYLIEAANVGTFQFTGDVVAAMFYLAIFPTIIATVAWNTAIRTVGPNRAAIFVNLIPIAGAALAMIFLGERLFFYHFLGALFVFAGIYLSVRHRNST